VLLPVPLLFAPELWMLARRAWRTRMVLPLAAVFSVPLFLYFGRAQQGTFHWAPIRLAWCAAPLPDALVSFVVYFLAVCLVDFAGIPIVLVASIRGMGHAERRWLAGALGFLACTWAVESVGYNNFCMRAMMLPGFVFFFLFASRTGLWRIAWTGRRRVVAAALALALSWGTLREAVFLLHRPLVFSSLYWRVRDLPPPPWVAPRLRPAYPLLARDTGVRFYVPDQVDRLGLEKFYAEKLVRGIPPGQMSEAELELLRTPLHGWLW